MLSEMPDILELIKAGLISFRDTNFDLVRFGSLGLAFGAGLFLVLILLFKFLWGRIKFSQLMSGHHIPKKDRQRKLIKLIFLIPEILLGAAVFFLLVSLANPYLPKAIIEELIESRERIDLIDVSPSKGWGFENTGKSAGEIGRKGYLGFLRMRQGQNDRVSLWYFSAEPTIVEDFIIDDDIYIMQAEDMPYVVTDPWNLLLPANDPKDEALDIIAPRDRIKMVSGEGSTNLVKALDAVIAYFDGEGDKRIKQKALLIETDAAVDEYPEKQLRELKKRRISIYFLYIKPNVLGEMQGGYGSDKKLLNAELLRKQVQQYGGKFYDVQDERSLEQAYRDINRLEKAPSRLIRHLLKTLIYQRPLMVAIVLIFLAKGLGTLLNVFSEDP